MGPNTFKRDSHGTLLYSSALPYPGLKFAGGFSPVANDLKLNYYMITVTKLPVTISPTFFAVYKQNI